MHDMLMETMWAVYACLFVSPFVQEDAALLAAAALAASGMGDPLVTYAVFLTALSTSDLWKYWLGRAAHTSAWARKRAERPAVVRARTLLKRRLWRTLFTVRFIPGARIATYIAAGYVRAPFARFALGVVFSAALLIALAFALVAALGATLGDRALALIPVLALGALVMFGAISWARRRRRAGAEPEPADQP